LGELEESRLADNDGFLRALQRFLNKAFNCPRPRRTRNPHPVGNLGMGPQENDDVLELVSLIFI